MDCYPNFGWDVFRSFNLFSWIGWIIQPGMDKHGQSPRAGNLPFCRSMLKWLRLTCVCLRMGYNLVWHGNNSIPPQKKWRHINCDKLWLIKLINIDTVDHGIWVCFPSFPIIFPWIFHHDLGSLPRELAASVQGAGAGDRFRVIPVHIAITVLGLEGSSNVSYRDHQMITMLKKDTLWGFWMIPIVWKEYLQEPPFLSS